MIYPEPWAHDVPLTFVLQFTPEAYFAGLESSETGYSVPVEPVGNNAFFVKDLEPNTWYWAMWYCYWNQCENRPDGFGFTPFMTGGTPTPVPTPSPSETPTPVPTPPPPVNGWILSMR